MSDKKETAVEWLEDSFRMNFNKIFVDTDFGLISHLIKQAKQMEKEQITKAYNSAIPFKFGEQYYNETYGK
jgi:endonuclease III